MREIVGWTLYRRCRASEWVSLLRMALEDRGLVTKEKPLEYQVDKNLYPDVWVKPEMVVEIMADEITKSPIHAFELALRFPRLVRFRDDKKVGEGTSKKELEEFFRLQ